MNDRDALLTTIFADPDDDAPRLVYADWLEENGEADHAAFIRVQIELARHPEEDEHWLECKLREEELWDRLRPAWAESLRSLGPFWRPDLKLCRRGFIERHSDAPCWDLMLDWRSWWRFCLFRSLDMSRAAPFVPALFHAPFVAAVEGMNLHRAHLGPASFAELAASPYLGRLRWLDLHDSDVGDAEVAQLAACASLVRLETLAISRGNIGHEGIAALAGCPRMHTLRRLQAASNRIGDAGVRALASSPHMAGLTHLDLAENVLTAEGIRALADSPHLQNLCELTLEPNEGIDESDPAVLRLASRPGLRCDLCWQPPEEAEP